ncbi:hypothetical protein CL634_00095 [bacterium]|nr:hypothetical protein [bacterium]
MKISIPKNRFLKNQSLSFFNSKFSWNEEIESSYVLGDKKHRNSIDPIFELLSIDFPELISPEVVKAFNQLGVSEEYLPIDVIQSSSQMIEKIKNAFFESEKALNELKHLGYLDTFIECNKTLKSLQRAQIDEILLRRALKFKKIKNASVASGFFPQRDGYLSLPNYSITKTLTGRMTITGGPQILTAPKLIRSFLKSSFKGGKIAQVDFVSLEPRVAAQLSGKLEESDVYEFLGQKLFDSKISRSIIKKLVLCSVYGASEATLKRDLPEGINVKNLIQKTKNELNYEMVVNSQMKNYQNSGKINNFFGRSVSPQSSRPSLIYNNYIQSTAVDVSLLGFGQIIKKSPSRMRPIFFIHDAMLVDLHPEDIENFKEIAKSIFIDGLGKFPLEFQFVE